MNWDWAFWIGGAVLGIGALFLLVWAVLWDRSRGRRRCPRCWYDMSGVPGPLCPECGREAQSERRLFRTRRRWGWALAAVAIGVVGMGTASVPRYRQGGWSEAVPRPILMLMLPLFDRQAEQAVKAPGPAWMGGGAKAATTLNRWEKLLVAHGVGLQLGSESTRATALGWGGSRLAALGEEAAPAIRPLLRLTGLEEQEARVNAIRVLGTLAIRPSTVVPVLGELLFHDDPVTNRAAYQALVKFKLHARPAIPAILQAIEARRIDAPEALPFFAELGDEGVLALARVLDESSRAEVRLLAAHTLIQARERAVPATRSLTRCLDDDARDIRLYSAYALAAVGGADRSAVAAAAANLRRVAVEDPDDGVRRAALWSAGGLDPDHEDLPAVMFSGLREASPATRLTAAKWLQISRVSSDEAIAELTRLLSDPDEGVRGAAEEAIAAMRQRRGKAKGE